MPEHLPSDPTQYGEEQAELQRQYEERVARVQHNMEQLYDKAVAAGKRPVDELLDENFDEGRKIFGDDTVDRFIADAQLLDGLPRDTFVERATARISEVLREAYFNPEVRARADALRAERSAQNTEHITFGHLKGSVHDFEWQEVVCADGTKLEGGDKVLEVSWPGDADDQAPAGIRDVERSLRDMATYVADHPEISGVIAVSWMMSRGAARRLGFQTFPSIPIEEKQQASVVEWASHARQDKPYQKGVKPEDVQLGIIPRAEFLRRYGA